jgi:hypothetical protein
MCIEMLAAFLGKFEGMFTQRWFFSIKALKYRGRRGVFPTRGEG